MSNHRQNHNQELRELYKTINLVEIFHETVALQELFSVIYKITGSLCIANLNGSVWNMFVSIILVFTWNDRGKL
jgi:hypothetical protein